MALCAEGQAGGPWLEGPSASAISRCSEPSATLFDRVNQEFCLSAIEASDLTWGVHTGMFCSSYMVFYWCCRAVDQSMIRFQEALSCDGARLTPSAWGVCVDAVCVWPALVQWPASNQNSLLALDHSDKHFNISLILGRRRIFHSSVYSCCRTSPVVLLLSALTVIIAGRQTEVVTTIFLPVNQSWMRGKTHPSVNNQFSCPWFNPPHPGDREPSDLITHLLTYCTGVMGL